MINIDHSKSLLHTDEFRDLREARDSCRKIIEYEGGLINSRISWLVAAQAFLLGTYAFLLNTPPLHINNPTVTFPLADGKGTYNAVKMISQVDQLRFWFSYIGVILAIVTSAAVFAGFKAIIVRNKAFILGVYAEASADLRRLIDPPLAGRDRRIWGMGTTIIGPMFVIVWVGLFVSQTRGSTLQLSTLFSFEYMLAVAGAFVLGAIWIYSAIRYTPVEELPPSRMLNKIYNRLFHDKLRKRTVLIAGNGALGSRIRRHLENLGHKVIFCDSRNQECFLIDDQGHPIRDEQRIKHADVLLILSGGDAEVKHVISRCNSFGIPRSCVIVNHSTVSISGAMEISNLCKNIGYPYLEMPVSGGISAAQEGVLSALYCGSDDAYIKALPYIKSYCNTSKCIKVAQFGQPAQYKLVNQVGIAGALLGVIESLAAAKNLGLNLQEALNFMQSGAADSWSMRHHAPQIVEGKFKEGLSIKNFLKDLGYVDKEIDCSKNLTGVQSILSLLKTRQELGKEEAQMSSPSISLEFERQWRQRNP